MPHDRLVALGADGVDAAWRAWDGDETERVAVRWDNEAWTVTIALEAARCECVLRVSPSWQLRQFLLFRDLDEPDLWLGTDGAGHWGEVNGAHRPDLDGGVDVSVGLGAFASTLPVRRLTDQVQVGGSAYVPHIVVDTDTLAATLRVARYVRTGARVWHVERDDVTEIIAVDHHGLPLDAPGSFRRLS